ncbi:17195_t:CDS:2, partial [Gigaspora rosea]
NGKRMEQVEKENSKSRYSQSRNSEPKDENSREREEVYARNIRSTSRRNSCSTKTWTDHRTLHTMGSDGKASGSTNEEIKETVEIKLLPCSGQRGGGSPTFLKVATGVNKGFCETKVSQAQKMSQNKKGQY